MPQKMALSLKPESWENLFDCLHAKGTSIKSNGNFWAAVQELERQFHYFSPKHRVSLGIAEHEDCR